MRCFLMRHGQSEANVADLIVSNATDGCTNFGLTAYGRNQVEKAATNFVRTHFQALKTAPDIYIFSSDFKRAKETAEILANFCETELPSTTAIHVRFEPALRERFFGDFDLKSSDFYQRVWEDDAHDPENTKFNVESPLHVLNRVQTFLQSTVKSLHTAAILILVAHGDTLQITLSASMGISPTHHRTVPHLDTAAVVPFEIYRLL